MVGEPYHGGDFMTLTQRAKDQRVQMTEEMSIGRGTVGSPCFRKENTRKGRVDTGFFFAKKKCKKRNIYI